MGLGLNPIPGISECCMPDIVCNAKCETNGNMAMNILFEIPLMLCHHNAFNAD